MVRSVARALASSAHHRHCRALPQCIIHVQSAYNENHCVWHSDLAIHGATPHDTVSSWYFNNSASSDAAAMRRIENCGRFGCDSFCQSYTYSIGRTHSIGERT